MKTIIVVALLSILSACASNEPYRCDDPFVHCNYVVPLPAHAERAVVKDGVVTLRGWL